MSIETGPLFSPISLGALAVEHRLAMAPMTRDRSAPRQVTDAVHAAGGQIVIQLMHTGRIAHPDNTPHGRQPILNRADADVERGTRDIADGLADVVTLGRATLANPDIVERVRTRAPLNEPDGVRA